MPTIEITQDEALVLYDCLSWWSVTPTMTETGEPASYVPIRFEAEGHALDNLFHKIGDAVGNPDPSEPGFDKQMAEARERIESEWRTRAPTF